MSFAKRYISNEANEQIDAGLNIIDQIFISDILEEDSTNDKCLALFNNDFNTIVYAIICGIDTSSINLGELIIKVS